MAKQKILIADDEAQIREILRIYFEKEGFEVIEAEDGAAAILKVQSEKPDILLLDIMMPVLDGIEVCKQVRKMSDLPIIMVTAKDDDDDRIAGLEIGADDYITKPFVISVVLSRVRAVLRRSQATKQWEYNVSKSIYEPDITFKTLRVDRNEKLCFKTLRVDRNEKLCFLNGEEVSLTKTEFDILLFLLTHRNRIYSRDEIIRQVWSNDVVVTNRTIDTNIARLRKKIGEYGNNIVTRLGFGYGFKETV